MTTVQPIDEARCFEANESFFSCTDERGVILMANEVFRWVSGYDEGELVGHPHSVIRHPDMPRAIFRLMWTEVRAGRSVATYVKNLAKDGRFYWVLAMVTPAHGGYLSVRIKPTSHILPQIVVLYREMRAAEVEMENAGDAEGGIYRATTLLSDWVRRSGFPDYTAMMQMSLLRTELESRDRVMGELSGPLFPRIGHESHRYRGLDAVLRDAYANGVEAHGTMRALHAQVEALMGIVTQFQARMRGLASITDDLRAAGLRAAATAGQSGMPAPDIGVTVHALSCLAKEYATITRDFERQVETAADKVGRIAFALGLARVHFEMAVLFFHEMLTERRECKLPVDSTALDVRLSKMDWLREAVETSGVQAADSLAALRGDLAGLAHRGRAFIGTVDDLFARMASDLLDTLAGNPSSRVIGELQTGVEATRWVFADVLRLSDSLVARSATAPMLAQDFRRLGEKMEMSARTIWMAKNRREDETPGPTAADPVPASP